MWVKYISAHSWWMRETGVSLCAPLVWCRRCHFNVLCCGLMLQMAADSAGASAPTGCRLWVKRSWCFCWSVCRMKKLSQETSSHSISTFTKKPKKVDSTYTRLLCFYSWICFESRENGYILFQASFWRSWTTWRSPALSSAAKTMQGCSSCLQRFSL